MGETKQKAFFRTESAPTDHQAEYQLFQNLLGLRPAFWQFPMQDGHEAGHLGGAAEPAALKRRQQNEQTGLGAGQPHNLTP